VQNVVARLLCFLEALIFITQLLHCTSVGDGALVVSWQDIKPSIPFSVSMPLCMNSIHYDNVGHCMLVIDLQEVHGSLKWMFFSKPLGIVIA